jgi:Short C-terminal domain
MPGLLRGVARTAVIAGTATTVSNRVSRRQARRWGAEDAQQAQEAPPQYADPEPPPADDPMDQLRDLAQLNKEGVLTDEEFAAAKAKILGT